MPFIPPETQKKRQELKRDLYNLLVEYSDGILKVNVWPLLMTKTALRLSNSEFRVGSMDAIFGLFVDMVHEEKRDGKTYICLNHHFSWESNNEVQQRAMRSMPPGTSGPVSSQVYVATPVHIQPLMSMPSSRLSNDSYIPFGSPAQQAPQMASNAFLAHQIGNVGPRMPGFRTSGQIPSLLPPPVVQHPGPEINRVEQNIARWEDCPEPGNDSDSDDSEEENLNRPNTISNNLIKMRIVDILTKTGPLKQKQLREQYKNKYSASFVQHAGYGIGQVGQKFPDAIEKFIPTPGGRKKKFRVKPKFQEGYLKRKCPVQTWNQLIKQEEEMVSSTDLPQKPVIDLTGESVIDLTADTPNFLSLNTFKDAAGPSTICTINQRGQKGRNRSLERQGRDRSLSNSRGQDHSMEGYIQPSRGLLQPTIDAPASYESLHANARPINKKRFEEKELNVAPMRRMNRYQRPTTEQVENCAQECIEIIAESNSYVSQERIEKLLLQRFHVRNLMEIGPRFIDQIGCVHEHNRIMAKINAYVQAFLKVRTICTLHELKDCLKEYAPGKSDFNKLNLGPLQRLPIIYQMFKFPTDIEEIPEITTLDVLEHLRNYLTKKQKWTDRIDLQDFMEYLVDQYDAEDAFQLGVRIRSLVLGVQVLKTAQRHTGQTRRMVTEGFKDQLQKDIESVLQKFRMTVMHTTTDGTWEVRNHYMRLSPEMAIKEIFQKFHLIMSIDEPSTDSTKPDKKSKQERKRQLKIKNAVSTFLDTVKDDVMARTLFHLAICVSNSVLEESALEILAPNDEEESVVEIVAEEERVKPSKATVLNLLKKYLDRCLQHGTLNLSLLDKIEEKITEECSFPSFAELGYGRFLHFTLQEAKGALEEIGGTSVGSGTGSSDTDSGYKPSHTDVLSFIHQCIQCGKDLEEDINAALCNQFNVKETKHLGYGKITNLMTASKKPGQHQYQEHSLVFEVAMGTDVRKSQETKIGMLGHQTREAALACLHNCPLLEDMEIWSHWSLVFEPELGKLKDFIQKYGGTNTLPVDGGKKLFTYHIAALETTPGVLLKLTSQTSTELFEEALMQKNPRNVCGQLMSLIVANKGMKNSPLALIANQMKSQLFTMHAADTNDSLPGAPQSDNRTDAAVQFVLACLVNLPVKTCVSLANQIFLEPLGQVVGSSKSKFLLLSACQTADDSNRLQELGCMLGVGEWTSHIQQKCQILMTDVEIIPEEEAEMIVLDDNDGEESDDDSDVASIASLSSILSDGEDDDVQIVSMEKASVVKKETKQEIEEKEESVVVELSTGDEDTQTEPDIEDAEFKIVDEVDDEDNKTLTSETKETEEEKDKTAAVETDDSDMEIITEEEAQAQQSNACEKVVNTIRKEEFGIGIELNEDGQRLKRVQDERLGRSLDRLSKDLYSKDTHFVLELIQNADDNDYPEFLARNGQMASVKFVMQTDGVIALNNESGFVEKNIRALCDVGRSTKGKHKFGYIGQKGIGFKSVFRVTDRPEVHSNGYHICFDVLSGPMGYILPHWVEDKWETGESWTTKIVLPLKEEMKIHMRSLAARFNDIHPSLLLFLHRLREITIDNKVENSSQVMRRNDIGNGVVEIEHNNGTDRWLVVKKMLDASKISLQAKSGVEVESTEIALAFPLLDQSILSKVMPPKQPVFAFLPLRSYGFRFIIQADFDVPSSREDVDRDSAWNQWIRNEIHKLFLEALEVFKSHKEFTGMKALINFLQFVPVEDEILDFFRPVSTQILKQLRAKPCLPTQPNNKGVVSWKLPTQVVTVKDALIREVVTPEFLQKHFDLFYLHREVTDMLNPTLIQCLGIESLTTNHLIQIGKAITNSGNTEINPNARIFLIAKWLACVYRSLDEFHDNQEIYSELKKMKMVPLASQVYISLEENTVFFPLSLEEIKRSQQHKDPLSYLQEDMNTIHPWFLSAPDNEVNSQVQKMLAKLNVCQLTPHDVINHHILPVLKSDMWKTKSRETLISYLVYIKDQTDKNSSLVNMDELANVAIVMTNQGEKNPQKDNVHFTPVYGNKYNLVQTFPGYDWILLDSVYIQNMANQVEKQKWHKFFSRLGVTDFITVRPVQVELDSESVKESAWSSIEQLYPEDFTQGCVIEDYSCDEIRDLLKSNKCPQKYELQMKSLCEYLDQVWDTQFVRYTKTKLVRKDNKQERDVESSFCIWLKTCDWLPAVAVKAEVTSSDIIKYTEEICRMKPSALYYPFPDIVKLLYYTVTYVDVNFNTDKSTFAKFLGLKFEVSLDDLINSLKTWGQRSDGDTPAKFPTSHQHIISFYNHLSENLTKKQIQDLLDKEPVIFVPVTTNGYDKGDLFKQKFDVDVAGQMLSRQEVWWEDKTGLFQKYQEILTEIHADIGNKKILSSYVKYSVSSGLKEFFKTGRIQMCPDVEEYAELLVHVAGAQNRVEAETLQDVMKILSMIGELMFIDENDPEKETKQLVCDSKKKKILNIFKGQNVIPTKRKTWTSLESKPLMADSKEYETIFENHEKVHFVQVEEYEQRKKYYQTEGGSYKINKDAMMSIIRMCEIDDLSAIVEEQIIFDMYIPCPKLQAYMVQCVPLLQKFLYNNYASVYNYGSIYQNLISAGIVETLAKLRCVETNKLEVKYWFKHDQDIYAIRPENCTLKNEEFIFHKDSVESYGEINKVIARVFSNNDSGCFRELRNFLTDVHSCILGQTRETIDRCLNRYNARYMPDGEVVWSVPPPLLPEPEPQPEPEPEPEPVDEVLTEEGDIKDKEDGEQRVNKRKEQEPNQMRAWPPMSDGKTHPPRPKMNMVNRENKESKVWPPPRAPDYMKSVKDLPSGVRVMEDGPEGDQTSSEFGTQIYRRPGEVQYGESEHQEYEEGQMPVSTHGRSSYLFQDGDRPIPFLEEITPNMDQDGGQTIHPKGDGQHPSTSYQDIVPLGEHAGSHGNMGDNQDKQHQEGAYYSTPRRDGSVLIPEQDGSSLGKRRRAESGGSDSSQNQPSAKKPDLRLGMPVWEQELGEYEEEELATSNGLKLPTSLLMPSSEKTSDMPEIGRLGELTVYQYLLNEMDQNPTVTFVNWCNEDEELGQPYDFEVGVVTEDQEFTVYIEVKSTLSGTKEIFEISYPQIKFAQENKDKFHVYRIFNADNPDKVRLVRIQNLAEKINAKQVRLCLLI